MLGKIIRTVLFARFRWLLAVTGGLALISPASAQTSITDNSSYVDALSVINSAVTGPTGNSYTLDLAPALDVTPGTGAFINAGTGNTVSIDGHGGALDGGGTLTPVVIFSGAVNLDNLTIQHGLGAGENGQTLANADTGVGSASGGGAELGGGLFIATSNRSDLPEAEQKCVRDVLRQNAQKRVCGPTCYPRGSHLWERVMMTYAEGAAETNGPI